MNRLARSTGLLFAPPLLLLSACASGPEPTREPGTEPGLRAGEARVEVLLEARGGVGEWIQVQELTLFGPEGEAPLPPEGGAFPLEVPHRSLAHGEVSAGRYDGVRLLLAGAWKGDPAEGGVPLLLDHRGVSLPLPIVLEGGVRLELIVRVELRRAAGEGIGFAPEWSLGLAGSLLPSEMVLAADDRAGGVIVVDRIRQRVHRTLLPGRAVAGLVRGRALSDLFLVESSRPEVISFDLVNGEERDRRRLPAGSQPVWASPLPDGSGLAIAMAARREVALVETPSLLSTGGPSTSRPPGRMASSSVMGRLFVLLPESDRLVVLSVDGTEVIAERLLQSGPTDLSLDRSQTRLAVACKRAGRLILLDTASLEPVATHFLGQGIQSVLFDDRDERLFVAFERPSRLQSVDPATGQALSRVNLPSPAADLELDPDGRLLWAACPEAGVLLALDRFQLRIRASIKVNGSPDRLLLPALRSP